MYSCMAVSIYISYRYNGKYSQWSWRNNGYLYTKYFRYSSKIDISRHFSSKIWNNNVYGRTFMFADSCMYLPLYKIKPHASYTYECTRLVSDTGIFFIIINRYFSYFLQIYKQAGFRLNSSLWGSRNRLHYIHFFICYFLSLSE